MSDAFVFVEDDLLAFATEDERKAYDLYVASEAYLLDPDRWVSDRLDEYLYSKQVEIMQSVVDYERTAVPSCNSSGKSFTAARLACWWLQNHVPGQAFVISTAPTFSQVRAILWREIGRAHRKAGLIGSVNQTEWHIEGIGLVGFGRKPADNDPQAMLGVHDGHVLVIIDEAGGVSADIFDAVESLLTSEGARVLAIGNPDDPETPFGKVCKPGSGWRVIPVSVFDTPNFTGEWVPDDVRGVLVKPSWELQQRSNWGVDSPLYTSRVLGQFPIDSSDGVIPFRWISQCENVEPNEEGPIDLGLDIGASEEGDATVLRERRGNKAGRKWELHTDDSEQIVGLAVQAIKETGAQRIKVDVIGVGFGVVGHLRSLRKEKVHDAQVIPVNVSQRSSKPDRFPNLRSQIWWEVGREASEAGGWCLADLDDVTLGELLAPKYSVNARGLTVVEPKDDTRKRLTPKRSPDNADALLLAFYEPVGHGVGKSYGQAVRQARLPT